MMSEKDFNKTDNKKEMIERYVYEVTKRVPQKMRVEIKQELEALIEDMREEEECTIDQVLEKLGDPAELAKKYRDEDNYVIGPEYYDNYKWILKIGILAMLVSAVVSGVVHGITGAKDLGDFIQGFMGETISTAISGILAMVGAVTIIFAVLEHKRVKVDIKPDAKWSPELLPAVPDKKSLISRADSIVSIVFCVVLAGVLVFVPEVFGAFEKTDDGIRNIACIFNLEEWSRIVPFFVLILAVGMLDEIIRLIYGQYCRVVMYSSIICNVIGVVGMFIVFKCTNVWNPDFDDYMLKSLDKVEFSEGDVLRYWGTDKFGDILIALVALVACLEVGVTVYKTLRYGKR